MPDNQDQVELNVPEMIAWIDDRLRSEGTEVDSAILERIFDLEADYMRLLGIVD